MSAVFCIHGVDVRLHTDGPELAEAAGELLRHFRVAESAGAGVDPANPALEIVFHEVGDAQELPRLRSADAEVLFEYTPGAALGGLDGWECTVSRDRGCTVIELAQGAVEVHGPSGRAQAWVIAADQMTPEERENFIYLPLTELLRYRGLYSIHAAALERNGVGVVIPALSGAGKTTCSVALLHAGWSCLSDDHPLFRDDGAGPELLPFPCRIEMTAETVRRFPGLPTETLRQGSFKQAIYPEQLAPIGQPCRPSLLLFPQIVDSPRSTLEPMSRSHGLEELMRHGLLVFDRDVATRQFRALGALVRQAACWRLLFGQDMDQVPALIETTLGSQS